MSINSELIIVVLSDSNRIDGLKAPQFVRVHLSRSYPRVHYTLWNVNKNSRNSNILERTLKFLGILLFRKCGDSLSSKM